MGVYNFSAGPSVFFPEVLEQIRDQLIDYRGSGCSLLETSHRSPHYDAVHTRALTLLRELYHVPNNYSILFCTGGATQQFAMLVDNFLSQGGTALYVTTGAWGKKALEDAQVRSNAYPHARIIEQYCSDQFVSLPPSHVFKTVTDVKKKQGGNDTVYAHITSNETIHGVQYQAYPSSPVPLIADCSSDLLSRPINFEHLAMIYGGAQKNIGPAGVTVVIIHNALLEKASEVLPPAYSYKSFAKKKSLYNTPPVFAIWCLQLTLEHIKKKGGLSYISDHNAHKARLVYTVIDAFPDMYRCPAVPECRSNMNIVFTLPDATRDAMFLEQARSKGFIGLRGHRSVGGIRASLYNAMSIEGATALAEFMKEFARTYG